MVENKQAATESTSTKDAAEMSESEIDKTLEESFPASDPPSWTLGTDHYHESKTENDDESGETE